MRQVLGHFFRALPPQKDHALRHIQLARAILQAFPFGAIAEKNQIHVWKCGCDFRKSFNQQADVVERLQMARTDNPRARRDCRQTVRRDERSMYRRRMAA